MLWYFEGEPIHVRSPARDPYTCLVVSLRVPRKRQKRCRPQRFTQWRNTDEAVAFAREAVDRYHPNMPALDRFTAYVYSRVEWEAAEYLRIAAIANRRAPRAIERALEWIRCHYQENLSIADLSAAAGVSEPRLYSLFRERFGESPMQRVIRFRIQHACDLLTTSNASVKEIAAGAGIKVADFSRNETGGFFILFPKRRSLISLIVLLFFPHFREMKHLLLKVVDEFLRFRDPSKCM